MSDDLQRIIGAMEAKLEAALKRIARLENEFILIGTGAVGLVVAGVLKSAGVW